MSDQAVQEGHTPELSMHTNPNLCNPTLQRRLMNQSVCYVLIESKMSECYNLKKKEMSKDDLNLIINNKILKRYFNSDVDYIKNKDFILLKELLH